MNDVGGACLRLLKHMGLDYEDKEYSHDHLDVQTRPIYSSPGL
jgi:hypothetical protein